MAPSDHPSRRCRNAPVGITEHAQITDREIGGTDMAAILAVRQATSKRVTAAGGITTWDEVNRLDAAGVDAVVGMAIYTGQLKLG